MLTEMPCLAGTAIRENKTYYAVVFQGMVVRFFGEYTKNFDGEVDTQSLSNRHVDWDGAPLCLGSLEEGMEHGKAWQGSFSEKAKVQKFPETSA